MKLLRAIGNFLGVLAAMLAGVFVWLAGCLITDDELAGKVYEVIKKAFND